MSQEQNLQTARPVFSTPPEQQGQTGLNIPYHRLALADPRHRWWKPLLVALVGGIIYLAFNAAIGLFCLALLALYSPDLRASISLSGGSMSSLESAAMGNPLIFLLLFGSVAAMFPALWVARLIFGPKPWGLIHSVLGHLRWGWLMSCFALAVVVYILPSTLLDMATGGGYRINPPAQGTDFIWMLALLFLLVPIQCYAEELVFRGFLMQMVGSWLKNPAWAIVLPSGLFMLGHDYDRWGQASVLTMGIAAGFLAWRTGGLEAGIALHVTNNLLAMGLGILGVSDPFLQEGSTIAGFAVSLVSQLFFIGAVLWSAHKQKIVHLRPVPISVNSR